MSLSPFKRMSLLLLIPLLTLVAACGSTSSNGGLSGSITFWMYQVNPNLSAEMLQLKAQFQAAHPGTTINIVTVPKDDFNTKLITAISTGTQPDASMLDQPLVAKFAGDGSTVQVPDGLISRSDLFTAPLNTNLYNSSLDGLPLDQLCVVSS